MQWGQSRRSLVGLSRGSKAVLTLVALLCALLLYRSVDCPRAILGPLCRLGRGSGKGIKVPLVFDQCKLTPDYARVAQTGSSLVAVEDASLAPLEAGRWAEVKRLLAAGNISVHGFYHVSTWKPYWWEVVAEQLTILDKALLDVAPVLVNVVGSKEGGDLRSVQARVARHPLGRRDMLSWGFNATVARYSFKHAQAGARAAMARDAQLSEGEYPTLARMHAHCCQQQALGRSALVFYMHNKGGCCLRKRPRGAVKDKTNDNVCAWREVMNALGLAYPSVCTRALLEARYATCGFEFLLDYPLAHYSGNFFWARCEHVARLPPMHDRFDSFAAELWLFNRSGHTRDTNRRFGQRCGYSTTNCCMDHYRQECSRDRWSWKLQEMLKSDGVLASNADLTQTLPGPGECY